MNRLSDLRNGLKTLDDARALFADIATAEIDLAHLDAKFEKKISDLKARHVEETAGERAALAEMAGRLATFIEGNKDLFEKPRKVKTEFGSFGLQTGTDLSIEDAEALIEALDERGYTDCLKVSRTPVKKAIMDRVEDGESFPGVQIRTGDTAVYKVDKTLVDKAKEVSDA